MAIGVGATACLRRYRTTGREIPRRGSWLEAARNYPHPTNPRTRAAPPYRDTMRRNAPLLAAKRKTRHGAGAFEPLRTIAEDYPTKVNSRDQELLITSGIRRGPVYFYARTKGYGRLGTGFRRHRLNGPSAHPRYR
jgi:hypothetical protein